MNLTGKMVGPQTLSNSLSVEETGKKMASISDHYQHSSREKDIK